MEGLEQTFLSAAGETIKLADFLTEADRWELKSRGKKSLIVTHGGVQRIADAAGINKVVTYNVLIQPSYANNYQLSMEATVCRGDECVNEIGEVNRSNLGKRGKNNPTNMAQKRAYDRAVFRLLGIHGLLSEEELADTDDKKMEYLTVEQQQKLVPAINMIVGSKTQAELKAFAQSMKSQTGDYTLDELDYLRKLYKKQESELKKDAF